jgi:lipopolysaccharide transport system ATP-binding protein
MSSDVIRVDGIGKRYVVGTRRDAHPTLRDLIADGVAGMAGRLSGRRPAAADDRREFWALRDVSFGVTAGEVVGLVGGNGAGKSTLLKILARITHPTEGSGVLHGRIGSLIEVGTGFHPELTGRENVYLNGVIIGMSRVDVARRFDEIVAFSGIEQFIDMPVKRYSSGMYLRLAFSVAAHLEPEIMLVDEVLAVGDAAFQKKCLGKMDAVARSGRTVIFVSHNLTSVQALCTRCLHVDRGRVLADGPPRAIITGYLGGALGASTERTWSSDDAVAGVRGARLVRASVQPDVGSDHDLIDVRTPFVIAIEYANHDEGAVVSAHIALLDDQGQVIFNAGARGVRPARPVGAYRDTWHVPGDFMNDGTYRVEVEIRSNGELVVPSTEALVFVVADSGAFRHGWQGKWVGAVRPMLAHESERLDGPAGATVTK